MEMFSLPRRKFHKGTGNIGNTNVEIVNGEIAAEILY